MGRLTRKPPEGAPEGTELFGGPVDRVKATLRLYSGEPSLDHLSQVLGCEPTVCRPKGTPHPQKASWRLQIDLNAAIRQLLARWPSDPAVWAMLIEKYEVDLFCGIFMESWNCGFSLEPDVLRMLADRHLEIGFDVY